MLAIACVAIGSTVEAQTFQVNSASSNDAKNSPAAQNGQPSLGWGSNIQNARLARAAETALQQGRHAEAFEMAQRAARAAPNDPQLWFLLGYAARLDGEYQQSIDAYRSGLRLNPSSLDGMSGLAQVDNLLGHTNEAESLLKQVVSSDPRRADDALLLGDIYLRSKNSTEAVVWLQKAEGVRPGARAELLLALAYRQTDQTDLADRYLKLAQQRDPNDPEVQRSMAGFYRDAGEYSQAITALKSIRNPKPDIVAELAYTYQLDGKTDQSATLYTEAANDAPRDLGLQIAAAQASLAAGFTDKASSFLARAATLDPTSYRLHAIRGQIAQLEDRTQDALKEYLEAVHNVPSNPAEGPLYPIQLHMDLMNLYKTLGDHDGADHELAAARSAINSLNESGPDRAAYLRLRALIRSNSGELDGAVADINEALALNTTDPSSIQIDGDILMKMGKTEQAIAAYQKILARDPNNRYALTSLGYASRAAGRNQDAEKYFERLTESDPNLYEPYLALGDLFAASHEYAKAEIAYSEGYKRSHRNALIVAGGMNAAIEAHNLPLARDWLGRVTSSMLTEPQVLREKERYLSFAGDYRESLEVGEQAIKVLPKDRDVVVYLGYDLLHLGRYDDLLGLTRKYYDVLPKEPDIPLLEGYVYKHQGLKQQALEDFTEVLNRDPEVVTAYVNRGYMLNDLHQPQPASTDFEAALKRDPNDGEARLGLAYANLDLLKPEAAIHQADLAERALGDNRDVHVIRATAYGREELPGKAAVEYRAALQFTPDDGALHQGLGGALFTERHYREAIDELELAEKYSPDNANVEAMLARSHASLDDRDQALQYIRTAEAHAQRESAPERSQVYLSTGQALTTLGDQSGAFNRFKMALETPNADRIGVRLAIAQLMTQQGKFDDAERQIALGWMEAAAGDTASASGNEDIGAADVFRASHDYELSQSYLERAKAAGAPDVEVRIGMANNYLALGETTRARAELDAVSVEGDNTEDYPLLIARANVLRQEHQGAQALTSFAQATSAGGEDATAEQQMLEASADEGLRVTPSLSLLSDFSIQPIFEDSTVYVLDSKLDATFPIASSNTALLPPPRSSVQTEWTDAFHLHLGHIPTPGGFFQVRNARGEISVPATNSIVDRNTTDYSLNLGLNPVVHLGSNVAVFNGGVQETIRRDSLSPVQMNQNLFRLFAYVSTSSFMNALSLSGYVIRESGPFTEIPLRSSQVTGALDFRVGRPWGKTAMVTGWGSTAQIFNPGNYENYFTSAYIGLERRFSDRLTARAVVEDLRSWRTENGHSGIAQNLRPAGNVEFIPKRNWVIDFSSAYSSTRDFHAYDATQNAFAISYALPFQRRFNDGSESLPIKYPIRFSAGIQQESFLNFSGKGNQQLRPYVQISLF